MIAAYPSFLLFCRKDTALCGALCPSLFHVKHHNLITLKKRRDLKKRKELERNLRELKGNSRETQGKLKENSRETQGELKGKIRER